MPKRSAKSRIERYARKIRKLEEKEKRRKIISPFDSSSESDNEGYQATTVDNSQDVIPDLTPMTPDISQVAGHEFPDSVEQSGDTPGILNFCLRLANPHRNRPNTVIAFTRH
ncbi:hypothetical protein ACJJTC_016057 [Scirpophaga incertulas]